ncbi:amidohydrolase family protein [Haloferax sp. MBLA0076]|uniref:Amidohydrolase family protein n=1 Tax=Haloferax litoreum TaxID=2666140 RepID=A0A6A8GGM2_9EURY|nr:MULTISPECIES: amidohydrolase family protein [Haloferax]KAB1193504.1 amidohydrolase family protein [Haloferax sp. CBA1148]MRX22019.1 amidohydrolase family protein [Haloferax litoreum]
MLLRDGRVIDGGRSPDERDVRVDSETGRIVSVGDLDPNRHERVVDLSGKTVTPGLVDAHVHFSLSGERSVEDVVALSTPQLTLVEARNARKTLEAGVTGVRVMGARDIDVVLKRAVDAGDVPGPRMVANCRSITITGGHGHHMGREIDGADDARRAVREQVKRGADFIKFMTTGGVTTPGSDPGAVALTDEELHALVDEAHRRGVHTATHAHGADGIKAAIRAGVDTVEHGTFLDDEAVDLFLEHDVTLVPTLSAPYHISRNTEAATREDVSKVDFVYDRHLESFRKAVDAGVTIAGGTDAGTPFNYHGGNASEIQFMAQHGMDPIDAIRAMTETAADAIGLEGCGVVEPDAHADLLVFDDDPLSDLTVLNDPSAVLKGGRVVSGTLPEN